MMDQDFKQVFPEVPQAFHEGVEKVLENLEETPRLHRPTRKYKWLAIASLFITSTVFASSIALFNWDEFIAHTYQVSEVQQETLIMQGYTEQLNVVESENGVTIKPYQMLKDTNGVEIYMEVTGPDHMALEKPFLFQDIQVAIKGQEEMSWSATTKKREEDDAQKALFILSISDIQPKDDKPLQLDISLKNLSAYNQFKERTVIEGEWAFSLPLQLPDTLVKTYEVNQTLEVEGYPITLKQVSFTPFTYTLEYDLKQVNALEDYFDTLPANEYGGRPAMDGALEISSIQLKDGTVISDFTGGGSMGPEPEHASYCIALDFGRVIDVEAIESIRIGKEEVKLYDLK